jgi:uncharacterized UPF0146 family protein
MGGIMRTTLNLPDDLIKQAMSLSHRTKAEIVIAALQQYAPRKKIEKIMEYKGKLQFDETREKSRHAR